jgi:hypothetical protein
MQTVRFVFASAFVAAGRRLSNDRLIFVAFASFLVEKLRSSSFTPFLL